MHPLGKLPIVDHMEVCQIILLEAGDERSRKGYVLVVGVRYQSEGWHNVISRKSQDSKATLIMTNQNHDGHHGAI